MSGRWVRRGSTVIVFDAAPQRRARADGALAREFSFETSTRTRPLLRQGASGAAVIDLQTRLASIGFSPGAADGDFGPMTDTAVRSFQRSHGLVADGVVGSTTWAAIDAAARSPWPSPTPAPAPASSTGSDPAIESLNLSEPARSAAYTIKRKHPWVVFTSGRRDIGLAY